MRKQGHEFGGKWTDEKLERLQRYLESFSTALKNTSFETIYIDAFAGTGARTSSKTDTTTELMSEFLGLEASRKGSAQIALGIEPKFDKYILIERDPKKIRELEKLKKGSSGLQITIYNEDANSRLLEICQTWNPAKKARDLALRMANHILSK